MSHTWTIRVLFSWLVLFAADSSLAESGNEFLNHCRSDTIAGEMYCAGVVAGVFASAAAYQHIYESSSAAICPPEGVSNDQLRRIAIQFLEANPKNLHMSTGVLVVGALVDAFPCTSTRGGLSGSLATEPL